MTEVEEDTRVNLRLSPQAAAAVREIMKLGNFTSMQDAIRRAIGDEVFLQRQMKEGWTVVLRQGREYRELVWPG